MKQYIADNSSAAQTVTTNHYSQRHFLVAFVSFKHNRDKHIFLNVGRWNYSNLFTKVLKKTLFQYIIQDQLPE